MKIAIVYTVKNEERLLRQNILYHKAIGIDSFFVYLDNSTDTTKDSIKDLPYVNICDSVKPEKYENLPFLNKFTSQAKEHHTARQCLNTYDAKQLCKGQQIDWLISIDADELFVPDIKKEKDCKSFFLEIGTDVDVINFRVYEALQRKISYNNVFKEETLFKAKYNFKRRFEKLYKNIFNPFRNELVKFPYWYGQYLGKAAIRVNSMVIPHNVHRYRNKNETTLNVLHKGSLLHYHFYDAKDFIKKFKNFKKHPDTFLSGNKVGSLKLLLRDVVNKSGMNEIELNEYFSKNLMFSEKEVRNLKRNKFFYILPRKGKILKKIETVSKIFNEKILKRV